MASEEDRREQAIRRIKAKRDFTSQAITFAVVGLILILIWFLTTRDTEDAFFWPVFPLLAMGFALVARGLTVFRRKPIAEDQVRRELDDDG